MSTPYRGGPDATDRSAPRDAGLVGDLVRQFADPYAFYRELVQNSIDAESPSIHVGLLWTTEEGGTLRVSVRDRGEGMDRKVLESQLLVLFRSGKEGREDKIGKFGVGFVSVLAVAPRRVTVTTSRGEGVTWTLVLYPDHTYELFAQDGGKRPGTTVTLEVPTPSEQLDERVARSEEALRTWCRHAQVPIRFEAGHEGGRAPVRATRIDEPLGLEALVSVPVTEDRGQRRAVVGLRARAESYAGFFNSGLLLWEGEGIVEGIAFKVQDARLEHTLSRDNVRRDRHFEAAVALARRAATRELPSALHEALETALADGAHERWRALLRAWLASGLSLPHGAVSVPLCDAWRGQSRAALAALRKAASKRGGRRYLWTSRGSTALTKALAERDTPVIDLRPAGRGAVGDALLERLVVDMAGLHLAPAREVVTCATPAPLPPTHERLLDAVSALLSSTVGPLGGLVLAKLSGAADASLALSIAELGAPPWVVEGSTRRKSPFDALALLDRRRPTALLNAAHPLVVRALERAAREPELAAAVLAQALLLHYERGSSAHTGAIVEATLRDTLTLGGDT